MVRMAPTGPMGPIWAYAAHGAHGFHERYAAHEKTRAPWIRCVLCGPALVLWGQCLPWIHVVAIWFHGFPWPHGPYGVHIGPTSSTFAICLSSCTNLVKAREGIKLCIEQSGFFLLKRELPDLRDPALAILNIAFLCTLSAQIYPWHPHGVTTFTTMKNIAHACFPSDLQLQYAHAAQTSCKTESQNSVNLPRVWVFNSSGE